MTEHKHGPVRWQEILGQTRYEELGICSCGQVIEVAERILDFCGTWHRKVKGEWRICHGSYPYDSPIQETDWKPITECSASVRVTAVEHLPALHELVIESAEDFVETVNKAIKNLRRSVSLMSSEDLQKALAERAKLNGQGE